MLRHRKRLRKFHPNRPIFRKQPPEQRSFHSPVRQTQDGNGDSLISFFVLKPNSCLSVRGWPCFRWKRSRKHGIRGKCPIVVSRHNPVLPVIVQHPTSIHARRYRYPDQYPDQTISIPMLSASNHYGVEKVGVQSLTLNHDFLPPFTFTRTRYRDQTGEGTTTP